MYLGEEPEDQFLGCPRKTYPPPFHVDPEDGPVSQETEPEGLIDEAWILGEQTWREDSFPDRGPTFSDAPPSPQVCCIPMDRINEMRETLQNIIKELDERCVEAPAKEIEEMFPGAVTPVGVFPGVLPGVVPAITPVLTPEELAKKRRLACWLAFLPAGVAAVAAGIGWLFSPKKKKTA
jgi:hypothetical protein